MWYAVFDHQYDKETLLKIPELYCIGILNKCFSSKVFWSWFFYAIWQGLLTMSFAFLFN
jgi:Phospholipid-translocating P-type ATPase C-terminal